MKRKLSIGYTLRVAYLRKPQTTAISLISFPGEVYPMLNRMPSRAMALAVLTLLVAFAVAVPGGALPSTSDSSLSFPTSADPSTSVAPTMPDGLPPLGASPGAGGSSQPPPSEGVTPGFGDRIRAAFQDSLVIASLTTLAVAATGLAAFALVTRYITPEEALKNPQRSMLYGFVRGNPGVHLKRLSDEFHMKTSSILWHIRKLENAELVRSERANGFRVFYPTEGGVQVKLVSRAVTTLQNGNARTLFEGLVRAPGSTATALARTMKIHAGTARWHLKKLKEFGLAEEIPGPDGAIYVPTPLGQKALAALVAPAAGLGPADGRAVGPVQA
jgi:predicted transcriptional regulator